MVAEHTKVSERGTKALFLDNMPTTSCKVPQGNEIDLSKRSGEREPMGGTQKEEDNSKCAADRKA